MMRAVPRIGDVRRVFLGIPQDQRTLDGGILDWLGLLGKLRPEIRITVHRERKRGFEWCRNAIVGRFLDSNCGELLMIDSDQDPYPSAVNLFDVHADIVGGFTISPHYLDSRPGRLWVKSVFRNEQAEEAIPVEEWTPDRFAGDLEVDAVGTGAILIKRRVFEDERMLLPTEYVNRHGVACDLADEAGAAPPFFRFIRKPNGEPEIGEDFDFCRRAKALGYRVVACLDARFGHAKVVDVMDLAGFGRGADAKIRERKLVIA